MTTIRIIRLFLNLLMIIGIIIGIIYIYKGKQSTNKKALVAAMIMGIPPFLKLLLAVIYRFLIYKG